MKLLVKTLFTIGHYSYDTIKCKKYKFQQENYKQMFLKFRMAVVV